MKQELREYILRLSDDSSYAIISPYRSENSIRDNRSLMVRLKNEVRKMGLGFNQLRSVWTDDEGNSSKEESLLIYNIDLKDALELGKQYNQDAIIYKDKNNCRLISTKEESFGDEIQIFNTAGRGFLNIEEAERIFSSVIGGSASISVKGKNKKPFKPESVEEVIQPRASYFENHYSYRRIL